MLRYILQDDSIEDRPITKETKKICAVLMS